MIRTFIVNIGDELLCGQTVNTNVAFLGKELTENQFEVTGTIVIPDNKKTIISELKRVISNNDLIIITGGLGPTSDDVTLNAITELYDTKLVIDESVLNDVKEFFLKRNRIMTKLNEDQALVPEISRPLKNEKGTAPGIFIEQNGKILIAMPGVPTEMKTMFKNYALPLLIEKTTKIDGFKLSKILATTGIPESSVYEKIKHLEETETALKFSYLPNQFGVKIKINITGDDKDSAGNKIQEIEQQIRNLIGIYIYGTNEVLLEEVVGRLLIDRQLSIAVAESCTGGLISHRLTNINGSSKYFERAVISYSNGAKVELLNVEEEYIQKYGAVSLEVARQMAMGVRLSAGTDIGLAVTGIMGPTGSSPNKPVGLVYIGLADSQMCTAREFRFGDDRIINKDRTSQAALEMLRRYLLGIQYND